MKQPTASRPEYLAKYAKMYVSTLPSLRSGIAYIPNLTVGVLRNIAIKYPDYQAIRRV